MDAVSKTILRGGKLAACRHYASVLPPCQSGAGKAPRPMAAIQRQGGPAGHPTQGQNPGGSLRRQECTLGAVADQAESRGSCSRGRPDGTGQALPTAMRAPACRPTQSRRSPSSGPRDGAPAAAGPSQPGERTRERLSHRCQGWPVGVRCYGGSLHIKSVHDVVAVAIQPPAQNSLHLPPQPRHRYPGRNRL